MTVETLPLVHSLVPTFALFCRPLFDDSPPEEGLSRSENAEAEATQ